MMAKIVTAALVLAGFLSHAAVDSLAHHHDLGAAAWEAAIAIVLVVLFGPFWR